MLQELPKWTFEELPFHQLSKASGKFSSHVTKHNEDGHGTHFSNCHILGTLLTFLSKPKPGNCMQFTLGFCPQVTGNEIIMQMSTLHI